MAGKKKKKKKKKVYCHPLLRPESVREPLQTRTRPTPTPTSAPALVLIKGKQRPAPKAEEENAKQHKKKKEEESTQEKEEGEKNQVGNPARPSDTASASRATTTRGSKRTDEDAYRILDPDEDGRGFRLPRRRRGD